jgi:hypothetical protein
VTLYKLSTAYAFTLYSSRSKCMRAISSLIQRPRNTLEVNSLIMQIITTMETQPGSLVVYYFLTVANRKFAY